MMRRTVLLAAAAALACSSDTISGPPDGLPHAAALPGCGPTDGPAVTIILGADPIESTQPTRPFLSIKILEPLDRIDDHRWVIGEGATAMYFLDDSTGVLAAFGSVRITSVRSDSTVVGSAELWFPQHGRIEGGFTAAWMDVPAMCG